MTNTSPVGDRAAACGWDAAGVFVALLLSPVRSRPARICPTIALHTSRDRAALPLCANCATTPAVRVLSRAAGSSAVVGPSCEKGGSALVWTCTVVAGDGSGSGRYREQPPQRRPLMAMHENAHDAGTRQQHRNGGVDHRCAQTVGWKRQLVDRNEREAEAEEHRPPAPRLAPTLPRPIRLTHLNLLLPLWLAAWAARRVADARRRARSTAPAVPADNAAPVVLRRRQPELGGAGRWLGS
jgi:hypothetical protein